MYNTILIPGLERGPSMWNFRADQIILTGLVRPKVSTRQLQYGVYLVQLVQDEGLKEPLRLNCNDKVLLKLKLCLVNLRNGIKYRHTLSTVNIMYRFCIYVVLKKIHSDPSHQWFCNLSMNKL